MKVSTADLYRFVHMIDLAVIIVLSFSYFVLLPRYCKFIIFALQLTVESCNDQIFQKFAPASWTEEERDVYKATSGQPFSALECTRKRLAAGLRLDPLWELTALLQTRGGEKREKGGKERGPQIKPWPPQVKNPRAATEN